MTRTTDDRVWPRDRCQLCGGDWYPGGKVKHSTTGVVTHLFTCECGGWMLIKYSPSNCLKYLVCDHAGVDKIYSRRLRKVIPRRPPVVRGAVFYSE